MAIRKAAWRVGLTALLLLPLLAIWIVPRLGSEVIREIALRELARAIPAEIHFGELDLYAFPPRLTVRGLEVREHGTPVLSTSRLQFDLAVFRSLWEGRWVGRVELEEPSIVYREDVDFWQKLRVALTAPSGTTMEGSFLPRSVGVRSGRVSVDLASLGLRASVENFAGEATIGGLVRTRVKFDAAAKVVVERAGARLELERAAARGQAFADGVVFDAGAVDGQSGRLRWSGQLRRRQVRGRLDWDVDLDPIFALIPEAGVVRGGGKLQATFEGPLASPVVVTELEARSVRIGSVEFSGEGRLTSHGQEWTLDPVRARIFGGEAVGTAHGRLTSLLPFELGARFHDWNPAVFIRLFGLQTPVRGTWQGEGRLAGDLVGADLHGGGRFSLQQGAEKVSGEASFRVSKDLAEVGGSVGAGPEDQVRCRYQLVAHSKMAGEVEGRSQRLGLFGTFVNLRLEGRGSTRAEFAGTLERPLLRGSAEATELSVEGIRFGDVQGPFEISSDGLRSEKVVVGNDEIVASGRIALTGGQQNDWSAIVQHGSLARAVAPIRIGWPEAPDLTGRVEGEVKVAGPWADLRLNGRAEISDASVAAERLGTVDAEVSLVGQRWVSRMNVRRPDGATGRLQTAVAGGGAISAELSLTGWKLEDSETVHRRWPALRGEASFEASVAGTVAHPIGEGTLRFSDLALAEHPWGNGRFQLRLDGERLVVEGSAAERVHLVATANMSRPHAFQLRADWHDLDLGPALVSETGLELRSTGQGELAGDSEAPLKRGNARITQLSVGRGAERLGSRAPFGVRIDKGAVEVGDVELEGSGQRFQVGARLTAEQSEFHAVGRGDLALLESISPSVASARGQIDLDLRGERRATETWRYHGNAKISGGALDVALLVGVTDIGGQVDIEGRELTFRELTGKLGGGEFLVAGSLGLDRGWDLGWALRDGSLGVPSWLDYRASGNGRLTGTALAPKLSGEIEVAQALYDRRIEWTEFLPWFRRQTRPLRTAGGVPVGLDLHVFADGGLFVDNNLAKAEMRGDLRLRGSSDSLVWNGTIEVLGGEFFFRRRQFEITSGNVQFHEDRPMNPDLAFAGETSVATRDEEYQIAVQVSGTADNPRIRFTADDPSLTENDVLALVTFGHTVADLQGQGGGIDVGEVLAITGPQGGRVKEQIQSLLRIDRIEIEPAYSRVSGVSEPRLRIAKDVTDRFSAVLGAGLGSERQQDVGIEYQLTRRLSVQGIWESQTKSAAGTFGGSLKFRVPFRSFSLLRDSFRLLETP